MSTYGIIGLDILVDKLKIKKSITKKQNNINNSRKTFKNLKHGTIKLKDII